MIVRALPAVQKFIDSLPRAIRAAVMADIKDIEESGLQAELVTFRQIAGKLWEIKSNNVRIFYLLLDSNNMILLHGYQKHGQKAPKHEIEAALKRMNDLLKR